MFATINSQLCAIAKTFVQSGVSVVLDNVDTAKMSEFIRFTMLPIKETGSSIGSSVYRRHTVSGVCTAQVFSKCKNGSYQAYKYADKFTKLYRNKSWTKIPIEVGNLSVRITVDSVDLTPVGERDGYYQLNVNITYRAEQIVAL